MMDYIIDIVVGLVVAVLTSLLTSVLKENRELRKKNEEKNTEKDLAIEIGLQCLLRSNLIAIHDHYTTYNELNKPVVIIPAHEYENWTKMYDAYKSLGGNGMIDHLKEDMDKARLIENKN